MFSTVYLTDQTPANRRYTLFRFMFTLKRHCNVVHPGQIYNVFVKGPHSIIALLKKKKKKPP